MENEIKIKSRECVVCGEELVGKQRRFCSIKCTSNYYRKKNKKPIAKKECEWCNNPFTPIKKIIHRFCSAKCRGKYNHNKKDKKPIIKKECEWCYKSFTLKHKMHKFCSEQCSGKYFYNEYKKNKIPKKYGNCEICDTKLKGKQKRYCSKFCRDECYRNKEKPKKEKSIIKKECIWCNTPFVLVHKTDRFCSKNCSTRYYRKRDKKPKIYGHCKICGGKLKGQQTKYCSKKCTNKNHTKKYAENTKKYKKKYYIRERDRIIKKSKENYEKNRNERLKYANEYRKNNKDKINKYINKRYKEDHKFRLNTIMSGGINRSLKYRNLSKNGEHWETLIINNLQEIIEHLEKNFLPDMTWKNYGKDWHIHHIIPKVFFNFTSTDDVEFKYMWSIDNLQPMWAKDNEEKSDKMMLWGEEINARDIDIYTNAI